MNHDTYERENNWTSGDGLANSQAVCHGEAASLVVAPPPSPLLFHSLLIELRWEVEVDGNQDDSRLLLELLVPCAARFLIQLMRNVDHVYNII